MDFVDRLPQLFGPVQQLAQLNEPSPTTIGVVTHLGGRTAHEDPDGTAALTPKRALVCRLLTRVSHTGLVEASPRAASWPATLVALEHPAVGAGVAAHDLVLWRFAAGTLRDRPRLLRCLFAEASPSGADGPR